MTIEETKQRRDELAKAIGLMVQAFEDETGVIVESVNVNHVNSYEMNAAKSRHYRLLQPIEIEISL